METKEDMVERAKAAYKKFCEDNASMNAQARFYFELVELEDRIAKLEECVQSNFMGNIKAPFRQHMFVRQLHAMKVYHAVLLERYEDEPF
jgi:hypothetical protein